LNKNSPGNYIAQGNELDTDIIAYLGNEAIWILNKI